MDSLSPALVMSRDDSSVVNWHHTRPGVVRLNMNNLTDGHERERSPPQYIDPTPQSKLSQTYDRRQNHESYTTSDFE